MQIMFYSLWNFIYLKLTKSNTYTKHSIDAHVFFSDFVIVYNCVT